MFQMDPTVNLFEFSYVHIDNNKNKKHPELNNNNKRKKI